MQHSPELRRRKRDSPEPSLASNHNNRSEDSPGYFYLLFVPILVLFGVLVKIASTLPANTSNMTDAKLVVVVGGGLAGLSAAWSALENGAMVTVVEKNSRLGGNSAKATSGINAVGSKFNPVTATGDNLAAFEADVLKSGGIRADKDLVRRLCAESGAAVDWLQSLMLPGQNLSDIVLMGGHSYPRTHRFAADESGNKLPVGFTITKMFADRVTAHPNATVLLQTQLEDISITNVKDKEQNDIWMADTVTIKDIESQIIRRLPLTSLVLASGGYAAAPADQMMKFRPDLASLPRTTGEFSTGDMVRIGEKNGLKLNNLADIQVHPTGFIDPKDPFNEWKFLCPEAARGTGAIMVDHNGRRFVNELGTRLSVSTAILEKGSTLSDWDFDSVDEKNITSIRAALLLMSSPMAESLGISSLKFYVMKGLIFEIPSFQFLEEKFQSLNVSNLVSVIEDYDRFIRSGQLDELTTKPASGPQFGTPSAGRPFYGAFVTPAKHFTMGGLQTDILSRVLYQTPNKTSELVPVVNIFAAGEVSTGVHGENRLGGNGCLESLVFGRQSGILSSKIHTGNIKHTSADVTVKLPLSVPLVSSVVSVTDSFVKLITYGHSPLLNSSEGLNASFGQTEKIEERIFTKCVMQVSDLDEKRDCQLEPSKEVGILHWKCPVSDSEREKIQKGLWLHPGQVVTFSDATVQSCSSEKF